MVLLPVYWILERLPATREAARRLSYVTIDQVVAAMVQSIEAPPERIRILDAPAMRRAALT